MTADDTKTVITPEQVAITYRLAGIGTRFAAVLVDTCLQVLAAVAVVFLFPSAFEWTEGLVDRASSWLMATVVLAGFLILWGYFIFWETVWSGRTPGKRLAGIRVMLDSGRPIDFRGAFLRNVCRYLDFLPAGYGVGAIALFLSRDSKRLGDYVAGTVVVVDAPRAPRRDDPPEAQERRLLVDPALLDLAAVSREQLAVVDRFLARRSDLMEATRAELARRIAEPLMELVGVPAGSGEYPFETFLEELTAACAERQGL